MSNPKDIERDIAHALNCNSAENASNTPDYILAQFLGGCLAAWNIATQQRETWHGRDARPIEHDVTVLPDGSAFTVLSLPLPKDHWLYAPRGEWDNERDDYAETPYPILTNAQREAVKAAARYAIRGATMCGQELDFDPDAMVLNFAYAMCGPANGQVLPADKQQDSLGGEQA